MNLAPHSIWPILALVYALALAGAAVGIRLAELPGFARRVVPFSGGLLVGIALFWVVPEIAGEAGWLVSAAGLGIGFLLLWAIDRAVYPICPECSHSHEISGHAKTLQGFSIPLLAASSAHSFFDGWSLAVAQQDGSGPLRAVFLVGVAVHKFPEGIALGVLLLAATGSAWKAFTGVVAVQCGMGLGALMAVFVSGRLPTSYAAPLLALSAGIFLFLGYHAVEGQPKEKGFFRDLIPALTGAAGAAVLRLLPGI